MLFLFFFFKQKTAYEMRISDWSSDVCSSDLNCEFIPKRAMATAKLASGATSGAPPEPKWRHSGRSASWAAARNGSQWSLWNDGRPRRCGASVKEIGRASCRERVCQYV